MSLLEIIGSDQYKVASAATAGYITDLGRIQQSDVEKQTLVTAIDAYLPALSRRVDSLSKQLVSISATYDAATQEQEAVDLELATIVDKGLVNNLQTTTLSYANADPEGKRTQAEAVGVAQTVMTTSMNATQEIFRTALADASVLSDRDASLSTFYAKYKLHLSAVKTRMASEISALKGIREALVTMRGIIDV